MSLEPAKITKPGHTSGCTLENVWDGGEIGDKRDFGVKLKVSGNEPGPYTATVEVTVIIPRWKSVAP